MPAFALVAALAAAPPTPDLSWLAGYWLSCDDGREVSETWSDPRGGVLLGTSMTVSRGKVSWEQTRIGPSGAGVSFFALPSGQAAAEFPVKSSLANEVVFENPAHDFPQRVIYRRDGDRLTGRIEGALNGKARSAEWVYRKAELNARCPR